MGLTDSDNVECYLNENSNKTSQNKILIIKTIFLLDNVL